MIVSLEIMSGFSSYLIILFLLSLLVIFGYLVFKSGDKINSNLKLSSNIFGLFLVHGVGLILLFAAIPHLTRVFGPEGWGKIVFVQVVINYLCWVSNWGFYLGGTKSISVHRDCQTKTSELFSHIWSAQILLAFVGSILLAVVAFSIPYFKDDVSLYLFGILSIWGNVLMPLWYVNGLEKVVSSALAQMAVKGLALPFIFIFINSSDDHYKYFLIYGLSTICIGIFTLFWMYAKLEVRFHFPKLELVFDSIKTHFRLFASSIFLSFNTLIVTICVNFYGGDAMLGYLNLAERIRNAAIQMLHPISHALFPRMGYLFTNDKQAAKKLVISIGIIMIVSSSLLGLALYIFADKIVGILGGVGFDQSIALLKILSISPLISTLFAFFVNQIAIPSGNDRIYFLVSWISVVLNALVVFPSLVYFGLIGVGIITLIIDIFALVFIVYLLKNKNVFQHSLFEKSN